jgi:Tfp pilus assembly protein PilF
MSSTDIFTLALQHHSAGNLRQAEQICQQIIQADRTNAEAYHLLGVLACQTPGKLDEAIAYFRRALQLRPSFYEAHNNLGNAYYLKGDLEQATLHYRHALSIGPNLPDAHCNLGNVQLGQGKLDDAIRSYRQALELKPDAAAAWHNMGLALQRQNKLDEAAHSLRQALQINPGYADAHVNLGNVLLNQEKPEDAVRSYQEALRLSPNSPLACSGLGLAFQRLNKLDDAIRCHRRALELDPQNADANCNLANALVDRCKHGEAETYLRRALQINADFPEALNALGTVLVHQDKLDEAIACFQGAIKHSPSFTDALSNLGNALLSQRKLDEAGRCFDRAVDLKPDFASAHWNRSFLKLLRGEFESGWTEYEWRWSLPGVTRRSFAQPLWDGSLLNGRTILLHAEQGLGDTMQFIRYAPLVKARGGKVLLECQPSLVQLLRGAPGIDRQLARGSALPPFDVHAPLLSLPGIFRTSHENIPDSVPYLNATHGFDLGHRTSDYEKVSGVRSNPAFDFGHRTSDFGRFLRVGIAWQGSTTYRFYRQRAIPLSHFAKLADVARVQLISLQKGPGSEELAAWASRFPILDLGNRLDERSGAFVETAAVIKKLDLVVSADTALPHLAGALACPVWLALSLVPDWRWQLEREDSQWYPTMRLFRQTRFGQWHDVFDTIAEELTRVMDEIGTQQRR